MEGSRQCGDQITLVFSQDPSVGMDSWELVGVGWVGKGRKS